MDSQEKTLSVPEAGKRYFGAGRAKSYQMAADGYLPLVPTGERTKRVSVVALERMLEAAVPAKQVEAA